MPNNIKKGTGWVIWNKVRKHYASGGDITENLSEAQVFKYKKDALEDIEINGDGEEEEIPIRVKTEIETIVTIKTRAIKKINK